MKTIFKVGDTRNYSHRVNQDDLAEFEAGRVHEVYATFALGRDAEWACRQFVLEMKEAHEEGIGTFLSIEHFSPAFPSDEVHFTAIVKEIKGNEIICSYEAYVGNRLIARGEQGQKIIAKEKLSKHFESIKNEPAD